MKHSLLLLTNLFIAFVMQLQAQTLSADSVYHEFSEDTIFHAKKVDKVAQFIGGEEDLFIWISQNVRYPADAKDNKIQGIVYCSFVIEKDGSISNAKVIKGIGKSCDQEVLRIMTQMPKWSPAIKDDKKVRCQINLPVKFSLYTKKSKKKYAKAKSQKEEEKESIRLND